MHASNQSRQLMTVPVSSAPSTQHHGRAMSDIISQPIAGALQCMLQRWPAIPCGTHMAPRSHASMLPWQTCSQLEHHPFMP